MREIDLYPIIRKQWRGICVRVDAPSRPGISDLVLVGVVTIFTEVKKALTVREKLYITPPQRRFIQTVHEVGGYGCVLAYVMENRSWYLITPDILEREWPTVRPAMGCNLGTNLQALEARIRSMSPVTGRKPVFSRSDVMATGVFGAEQKSTVRGKPESITSFR